MLEQLVSTAIAVEPFRGQAVNWIADLGFGLTTPAKGRNFGTFVLFSFIQAFCFSSECSSTCI